MESSEVRLLLFSLFDTINLKYKEKINGIETDNFVINISPRYKIKTRDEELLFRDEISFLEYLNKNLNFPKFKELIKKVEEYNKISKKYEVLEFSPSILNPVRKSTVFLESPYYKVGSEILGCLLKYRTDNKSIYSIFLESLSYNTVLSNKKYSFKTDTVDFERLRRCGIVTDKDIESITFDTLPKILVYKNDKEILKIPNASKIINEEFLDGICQSGNG